MKVSILIMFAGLIGAIAAPALAQTSTNDSSTQIQSTQRPNNPQKPYVDTPGINKGADPSNDGATGAIGGSSNTGGSNATGGNSTGGNGNTGNTAGGGTGTGGAGSAGGGVGGNQ
jgi:hypothetical protein